jgi:lipoprotein-releasing system ATP-binding protein
MSDSGGALIRLQDVGKAYVHNSTRTEVLRNVNLDIRRGELLAVVGPSGAGKSTLLNIIGTVDHPTAGTVSYGGTDLFGQSSRQRADFRNRKLGFVFQFHHLLPEFTALENIVMPARIAGADLRAAEKKARELLGYMGLAGRLTHKPGELSGGEQQRVAVARSLIMNPEVVLADEPTGNLDTHTGQEVFEILSRLNRDLGMTLIIVTHNEEFAKSAPRRVVLVDGEIVSS